MHRLEKLVSNYLVTLYGGRVEDSSNKTPLDAQKPPPTERAAYFHLQKEQHIFTYRKSSIFSPTERAAYFHLQKEQHIFRVSMLLWLKPTVKDLDQKQWGWKHADTIQPSVPAD